MRAFVITCPELPESRKAAEAHFASRGLAPDYIRGIHAKTFGILSTHPYELDHPGQGWLIDFKSVGLYLSHYLVWSILEHVVGDQFMVLEDDAEFPLFKEWSTRLRNALAHTPLDFDLLYIGSCNCMDKPMTRVGGEVFKVDYPQCTHAYVVMKKALPVLLDTHRDVNAPIDISMVLNSLPKLKVYTVLPRIVGQRNTTINP